MMIYMLAETKITGLQYFFILGEGYYTIGIVFAGTVKIKLFAWLSGCRVDLNKCETQWQDFDQLHDGLVQFVKEKEAKVREEAGLRPDIHSKEEQLSRLKVQFFLQRHFVSFSFLREEF